MDPLLKFSDAINLLENKKKEDPELEFWIEDAKRYNELGEAMVKAGITVDLPEDDPELDEEGAEISE